MSEIGANGIKRRVEKNCRRWCNYKVKGQEVNMAHHENAGEPQPAACAQHKQEACIPAVSRHETG